MPIDRYPQFMNMEVIEIAANTYKEQDYPSKVIRQVNKKGDAFVMNLMKIIVQLSEPEPINVVKSSVAFHIADRSFNSVQNQNQAGVIISDDKTVEIIDTAATDGTVAITHPSPSTIIYDLTDGNGNGILYGKQIIYVGVQGGGNLGVKGVRLKLLYTSVQVGASELLGIIQD